VLIALLAAGYGEKRHAPTEAERVKMESEFSQVAMNIANATITPGPADETTMEQFTNDYIGLTRKYADDLGDAEVKKRLTDEVAQVPTVVPAVRRPPLSRARQVLISREGT
jgi:hypothetical protein